MRPLPAQVPDLTGRTFGRLTAIGVFDQASKADSTGHSKGKKGGAQWVVRCRCGNYETRRTTVLTQGDTRRLMCRDCDKLEEMKRGVVPAPSEREALRRARKRAKAERRAADDA
jgi:hypothetical protein